MLLSSTSAHPVAEATRRVFDPFSNEWFAIPQLVLPRTGLTPFVDNGPDGAYPLCSGKGGDMAFTDWVNFSPQNKSTAVLISQIVMKHGLTQASAPQQIFDALKQWTSGHAYDESADNLSAAIQQKRWNCVSLSRLLVVTYCAARDLNPNAPAGVVERRINSRKLSAPGVRANIASLPPNVTRQDLPAERRYTFSGHTYVAIGGTDYDLLMGTNGLQVTARFPIDVVEGPGPNRALQCTIAPHTFRLTPTGARVGPLPGFRLERV